MVTVTLMCQVSQILLIQRRYIAGRSQCNGECEQTFVCVIVQIGGRVGRLMLAVLVLLLRRSRCGQCLKNLAVIECVIVQRLLLIRYAVIVLLLLWNSFCFFFRN